MRTHKNQLTGRARDLRVSTTDAEKKLWQHLRNRQLGGLKFRRQVPVGSAIADFLCIDEKLIIEVDGGQHAEQKSKDTARTTKLEAKGYRVLRFWNDEVLTQTDAVLDEILRNLETDHPQPNPLPEGEGETTSPLPSGERVRVRGKTQTPHPHPGPLPEGEGVEDERNQ